MLVSAGPPDVFSGVELFVEAEAVMSKAVFGSLASEVVAAAFLNASTVAGSVFEFVGETKMVVGIVGTLAGGSLVFVASFWTEV